MSDAVAAVERLREAISRLGKGLHLPVRSECEITEQRLSSVDHAPQVLRPAEIEAIRREVFEQCELRGVYALPPGLMRDVPLVLWNGTNPAASITGLFDAFLEKTKSKDSLMLRAIEAWLRDFAPEIAGFTEAGKAIASRLESVRHPKLLAWRGVSRAHRIFDAHEGPKRLGRALLTDSRPVQSLLAETTMDDPLRGHGRFFRATLQALLDAMPSALSSGNAAASWNRARPLLEITNSTRDRTGAMRVHRTLRFESMEAAVALACLKPWLEHRAHVSAPKADILSFLVATIGDPRLRPERWTAVGDEATRLVRSWLSAATLEAFLALINDAGDTNQWRYRQAFWRACLDKIPGAEVWVVLGKDLARQATLVSELRGSFGQMNAGAQAVLLMRLGDIIFSEWSNVGSLRAWDIGDKNCPKMDFVGAYDVEGLRARCLEFPDSGSYTIPQRRGGGKGLTHYSPQSGLWQSRAAALIRVKTGIQLQPRDYMPTGS